METKLISCNGYCEALYGLGLSRGITSRLTFKEFISSDCVSEFEQMKKASLYLTPLDKGHNKFLESIILYLEINAPRYWWQEFDTYRIGVTKQSESTMYTLGKRTLTKDDFESGIIDSGILTALNRLIAEGKSRTELKQNLPEGFLQKRIVCLSLKTYLNMYAQRHNHKLALWKNFLLDVLAELPIDIFHLVEKYTCLLE